MKYDQKTSDIPEDVMNEIDFMLGSIEECNSEYLLPILLKHDINPDGGFVNINAVDDAVIIDIYKELFETGIIEPFVW